MATNNYKCPACNGVLEFDIETQKLKCPFCGSVYEISDFLDDDTPEDKPAAEDGAGVAAAAAAGQEAGAAQAEGKKDGAKQAASQAVHNELGIDTDAGTEWGAGEAEGLSVFTCKSCGGEIVGDQNTAASKCPYCDSVMVRKEALSGSLRPDYVIPFKLDKKTAKEAFAKHLLGKKLVDENFVNESKIDEIKGLYVPFWLFDVDTKALITYRGENSSSYRSGDYMVYETDIYEFDAGGTVGFENIPFDGSSKMADDLMESLEPFDFKEAVPFQTAYLAGYMADKYDVTIEAGMPNINRRIKGSVAEEFRKEVPSYGSVSTLSSDIRLTDSDAKYALYPVWILNIKWGSKRYTYAMNGQTGKFVGDALPEDKAKAKKMRWIPTGIMAAAGAVLGALAGMFC